MNEKEAKSIMQNMDNDLIDQELDALLRGVEIDMDSISRKAHAKLEKGTLGRQRKRPRAKPGRRWLYPAVASMAVVIGLSSAYGAEISDFVRSFFNKTEIYQTVVDGKAYYLGSAVPLGNGRSLDTVLFTAEALEINMTYQLEKDEMPPIEIRTPDGRVYKPGGYGTGRGGLVLGFWNETEQNYRFVPTPEIELVIGEESFAVALDESVPVLASGDIVPALQGGADAAQAVQGGEGNAEVSQPVEEAVQAPIDWLNIGYKKTDKGIMIVTSFADEDMELVSIGKPSQENAQYMFKNEGSSIIGSGTGTTSEPLTGYDQDQNAYTYTEDPDAVGTPVVQFISDGPCEGINLELPCVIVGYRGYEPVGNFSVEIPGLGEEAALNKELDLRLQKMVLQSIERTSGTTAELRFALNTGDKKEVSIRAVNMYSKDVISGECAWQGDVGTMEITFEEGTQDAAFSMTGPQFAVNGNWVLALE